MALDDLARWRLLLGDAADASLGGALSDGRERGMDAALAWLYGRDPDLAGRDVRSRGAGSGESTLSVPEWIDQVQSLFPKETCERLERDAVERYQIDEVVTREDVLARVQPSESLLRAVLRTKHLMKESVLAAARKLV